jgi:hypothetical protein
MARHFEDAGIASAAVTDDTPGPERDAAVQRLEAGKLQALFTVDLFNEGVDISRVDTVLFLRPTVRDQTQSSCSPDRETSPAQPTTWNLTEPQYTSQPTRPRETPG